MRVIKRDQYLKPYCDHLVESRYMLFSPAFGRDKDWPAAFKLAGELLGRYSKESSFNVAASYEALRYRFLKLQQKRGRTKEFAEIDDAFTHATLVCHPYLIAAVETEVSYLEGIKGVPGMTDERNIARLNARVCRGLLSFAHARVDAHVQGLGKRGTKVGLRRVKGHGR